MAWLIRLLAGAGKNGRKTSLTFTRNFHNLNAMIESEIRQFISSKIFGKKIYCFDLIDSTNLKAKQFLQEGVDEGTVVIADEQTAGRGRLNRSWISEGKKNLTFSVIIRAQISPEKIGVISIYAGLSVMETLKQLAILQPDCKWPNDVYLCGKKVCGILSESVFENNRLAGIVIGIGLNINQIHFQDEIKDKATSLSVVLGEDQNRFEVLGRLLDRLENNYELIKSGKLKYILEKFENHSSMFSREVKINQNGQILHGIASRLDDDGGLIVKTTNSEIKVIAGDVSICY
ncbi:MAG: biotin--[acetyl-CoA-carboxylase] ligase [Ignavibacteriales bacterium]|nr:biotin--[acetyl-CoA-carboxylase] ligase [Ignavibacteriales bacterium]